jgi:hypothetical protein
VRQTLHFSTDGTKLSGENCSDSRPVHGGVKKLSEEIMRTILLAGVLAAAFTVTACENKTEKAAEASAESTKAAEAAAQASSAASTAADASATAAAAGDKATAEAAGDQAKEAGKAAEEAGDAAAKAGDKAKDAAH